MSASGARVGQVAQADAGAGAAAPVALPPASRGPAPRRAPVGRLRLKPREDPAAELNMTSMTDVIFILLIFFISLSEIRASQVKLDMPEVSDAPTESEDDRKPSAVEITKDGRVLLEGREVAIEALVAELQALQAGSEPGPRVRIRGDREGQFGVFAQVLASLARAKISDVEIEVQAGP